MNTRQVSDQSTEGLAPVVLSQCVNQHGWLDRQTDRRVMYVAGGQVRNAVWKTAV